MFDEIFHLVVSWNKIWAKIYPPRSIFTVLITFGSRGQEVQGRVWSCIKHLTFRGKTTAGYLLLILYRRRLASKIVVQYP